MLFCDCSVQLSAAQTMQTTRRPTTPHSHTPDDLSAECLVKQPDTSLLSSNYFCKTRFTPLSPNGPQPSTAEDTHSCPPVCLVCSLSATDAACASVSRDVSVMFPRESDRQESRGRNGPFAYQLKHFPFFFFFFFSLPIVMQHSNRRTVPIPVRARRPVISPATVKSSPWSRSPARARLAISPGSTTSPRTTSGTSELLHKS